MMMLAARLVIAALLQTASAPARDQVIQIPKSANLTPHFESIEGRQVFFVDGRAFTILASEIPWWDMVYGRYRETLGAYDHLYPAARALGMNALKVPIKWSLVEPQKGVYDFSYLDHAKQMAEKNGLKLVVCWFGHMMVQIENEIAVFGWDRQNRKFWRAVVQGKRVFRCHRRPPRQRLATEHELDQTSY